MACYLGVRKCAAYPLSCNGGGAVLSRWRAWQATTGRCLYFLWFVLLVELWLSWHLFTLFSNKLYQRTDSLFQLDTAPKSLKTCKKYVQNRREKSNRQGGRNCVLFYLDSYFCDHKAVRYTYKHYLDPYAPEIWFDFSSCTIYSAFLKTPSGWCGLRRWCSQICLFLGGSVSKKVGGSVLIEAARSYKDAIDYIVIKVCRT